MDLQNLAYALTQLAHNFGAVAVVGGSIFGRWPRSVTQPARQRLAWLVFAGWMLQGISGLGFGAISFGYYGQFPDIHGVALVALYIKMACAVAGITLTAVFLRYRVRWSSTWQEWSWTMLILLALTALMAAAFLRWFS
jgi:hypothetical protein